MTLVNLSILSLLRLLIVSIQITKEFSSAQNLKKKFHPPPTEKSCAVHGKTLYMAIFYDTAKIFVNVI